MNYTYIAIFIITIIIMTNTITMFHKSYQINISTEDEIYMEHFNIYGNRLFQIYGIVSLIKSIFIEEMDDFASFFDKIKPMIQYKYGDSIEVKSGHVEFSTKIIQKQFNNIQTQTYFEVLYPISKEHYIAYYRIVKMLNTDQVHEKTHIKHEFYII